LERYDNVCRRKSNKEREKLRKKMQEFERFKKGPYAILQKKVARLQAVKHYYLNFGFDFGVFFHKNYT
jgi:hypothetical protein